MKTNTENTTWERPTITKVPLIDMTQASTNRGNDGVTPAPTAS